jgi:hypothetical protein
MSKRKANKDREHRIAYEIVVDCCNEEERSSGWHCYLEENLKFPFKAECIMERRGVLLRKGEQATVTGMSDIEFCSHEMFVDIEWAGRTVAVPLELLKSVKPRAKTVEAIEDWHYWKKMGYEF